MLLSIYASEWKEMEYFDNLNISIRCHFCLNAPTTLPNSGRAFTKCLAQFSFWFFTSPGLSEPWKNSLHSHSTSCRYPWVHLQWPSWESLSVTSFPLASTLSPLVLSIFLLWPTIPSEDWQLKPITRTLTICQVSGELHVAFITLPILPAVLSGCIWLYTHWLTSSVQCSNI